MSKDQMTLEEKLEQAKDEIISSDYIYYDFCDNYTLEDNIQNFLFNQKYNIPGLQWIFIDSETGNKTRALTTDLFEAIDTRILNNSHIVFFIYGPTNSGKSELAIAIAKYYQYRFWKFKKDIDIHLTFSDSDIGLIIPKLDIGDITIRDESSIVTGEESRILQMRVNNLIRVVRAHQNSFIFVNPDILKVPLVDYYLETAGKHSVHICTKCNMDYINYPIKINPKCPECGDKLILDYSKCKIRAILYDREQYPIGRIYLTLSLDQEFRQKYEELKFKNIQRLKITSGLVPVQINDEKLERDLNLLLELCLNGNIDTKIGMRTLMHKYNRSLNENEKDKQIGGTEQYNRMLFEETSQMLEEMKDRGITKLSELSQQQNEEEQPDPFEEFKHFTFPYSYDDIIKKAKKQANFRNIERDFEIYFKVQDGIIYEDIIPDYPDLSDKSSITKIVQKTQGLINRLTGYLLEKEYTKFLQTLYKDRVIHDGSPGKPDAYVIVEDLNELHIFSIKYLNLGDKYKYIPIKELNAELEFAWENRFSYNKVRLFNIVLNYSMQEILVSEIKDFSRTKDIKL